MTTTDHHRDSHREPVRGATARPIGLLVGLPVELVEVFGDAIADTTGKTRQLADVLDHLAAARTLIGPRLGKGWHVHHDPSPDDPTDHADRGVTGEVVAIAEPVTAPATLATVEAARQDLAVLIDAFRACLHAQIETAHDLTVRAHQAGACTVLTPCPHCPPTTAPATEPGAAQGWCESCHTQAAVTTWPPVAGATVDADGVPAPFRVCSTCQPTGSDQTCHQTSDQTSDQAAQQVPQ